MTTSERHCLDSGGLLQRLRQSFGYDAFRPGQERIIRRILSGENLFVVMPTGAGKSLCYQLPAVMTDGVTLVVSPLIALMKDQVDALMQHRIRQATYVNSSLTPTEVGRRLNEVAQRRHKLVYVAPERFRSSRFVDALRHLPLSYFVIDEAHCISEWGHDFRPDYLALHDAIERLKPRQVLAFTATATRRVRQDAMRQIGVPNMTPLIAEFDRRNLSFEVRSTPSEAEKLAALKSLVTTHSGSGITYVGTRADAELVADFLQSVTGQPAAFYHGGMEPAERMRVQEAFMKDEVRIVAATKAFGMGIDKSEIRFIYHFRLPSSVEAYYQEAGRAGRDGGPAHCVVLYSPDDRALQEYFIEQSCPTLKELRTIVSFFHRRAAGSRSVQFNWSEFLGEIGLHDEKVEVGLRALETVQALRRCEQSPARMTVELLVTRIDDRLLRQALQTERPRQQVKQSMLRAIIGFAESNDCRRRLLLRYFGDPAVPPRRPDCCDNCRAALQPAEAPAAPDARSAGQESTRDSATAHEILRCVHSLPAKVGQKKLGQILAGSKAKWVRAGRYDRVVGYGLLGGLTQTGAMSVVGDLRRQGLLKLVGGDYPVVTLSAEGERVLAERRHVSLKLPTGRYDDHDTGGRTAQPPSSTVLETLQMFRRLKSAEAVAAQRGLACSTVYFHLSELIGRGWLACPDVVSAERQQPVRRAVAVHGPRSLRTIKEAVGNDITYDEIRCVVAAIEAEARADGECRKPSDAAPVRQPPGTQQTDSIRVPDDVRDYLESHHPRRLRGAWEAGFAVDFTGRFTGGTYRRTKVGELLYRYKYRRDAGPESELTAMLCQVVCQHPELQSAGLLVTVPPTQSRHGFEPVERLANQLGRRTGMSVDTGVLARTRTMNHQKNMTNPVQKEANVRGAFRVSDRRRVAARRVLLLDDFYDSGATLNEATRVLLTAGAASVVVLTAGKTIHH